MRRGAPPVSLAERAIALVLRPRGEWSAIAEESTPPATLLETYAMRLAAIPPVCAAVGLATFGATVPLTNVHLSYGIVYVVGFALVFYLKEIVQLFVAARAIELLARRLGAAESPQDGRAMRVSAYAFTPVFLGGVFALYPPLASLTLATALYGCVQFGLGGNAVLGLGRRNATLLAVATFLGALVLGGIVQLVLDAAIRPFGPALPPDVRH